MPPTDIAVCSNVLKSSFPLTKGEGWDGGRTLAEAQTSVWMLN